MFCFGLYLLAVGFVAFIFLVQPVHGQKKKQKPKAKEGWLELEEKIRRSKLDRYISSLKDEDS